MSDISKKELQKTYFQNFLLASILWIATLIPTCSGHGRLIEPPSRASAWRYGFQTPPNYNDHELYCGGFARQWHKNDGKCGECGDAWDVTLPRPHEYGGKWGQGVITRKYNPGSDITLRVELTASHMGFFEFRVCPDINGKQDCLDKHVLQIVGGSPYLPGQNDIDTRFYPRNGSRIYEAKARLPGGLKCDQCLLQWRYVAGNNWGTCPDGTGAVGCGPQEEFRACADISIGDTGRTTMRPFRPGVKTTTQGTNPPIGSDIPESGIEDEVSESYRYIGPIIALLALLVVLCILAAIYLFHYHGQRVKQILRWKRNKGATSAATTTATETANESLAETTETKSAPVPPPRTKRLSYCKDIDADDSSVVIGQPSPQSNA